MEGSCYGINVRGGFKKRPDQMVRPVCEELPEVIGNKLNIEVNGAENRAPDIKKRT